MTPKEKAQELFDKILNEIDKTCDDYFTAKQCALIAVDEILKICVDSLGLTELDYWQDVKQEIEAL
jgi:hypothetical protein